MLILKKIWAFIKHYWKPILLVVAILPFMLLLRNPDLEYIKDYIKKKSTLYKKEVEAIELSKKEELERKRIEEENFRKAKIVIEEKYNKKFEELDKAEKKKIEQISKEIKEDPTEYIKKIAKERGWEYIE